MNTYAKIVRALSVSGLFAAVSPIAVFGQKAPDAPIGRVGVTVALAENYPFGDAPAVIMRHGAGDVIVMPAASATPGDLVSAVLTIEVFMDGEGDKAPHDAVLRVERLASLPTSASATAAKVLDDIYGNASHNIAHVGPARSGIIYIPNSATRAHEKARGKLAIYPKSTP
jgi:hypothetical protein